MNTYSPYYSSSTDIFFKRFRTWRRQYLHVVIYTSLFWIVVDVFLIMLFSDCTKELVVPCSSMIPRAISQTAINQSNINVRDFHQRKFLNKLKKAEEFIESSTTRMTSTTTSTTTSTSSIQKWWEIPAGASNPSDWPGEGGRAVIIPETLKNEAQRRFVENQFNILASDLMALNRSIKDQRSPKCFSHQFPDNLPTTSIVIVFHNEGNSTLLRTLTSIVIRSPIKYIHEIILVDDASVDRVYLKDDLELFVKQLPVKVHIIRNTEREGLMKSRLKGAQVATGDTLTFLDAHIECSPSWLEYLLTEVKKDRTAVVCPIIDVINDNDFAYLTGSDMTWGGFNWRMNFRWYPVPAREDIRRGHDRSLPLLSPTMAGGLFTIDRAYFYEIGSYDPGMEVWGGENLEMSFRVWQCGGKIMIHPCSHVGHVFRKQTPYTFPGGTGKVIFHNNKRLVEVWLDKYKDFVYAVMPELKNTEAGDVSDRLALRNRLKCKDFEWYLRNIYPESSMPVDFHHVGSMRSEAKFCVNFHNVIGAQKGNKTASVDIKKCIDRERHAVSSVYQILVYQKSGHLRFDDLCLEGNPGQPIKMQRCLMNNQKQMWNYTAEGNLMKHNVSGFCMTGFTDQQDKLILAPCDETNPHQKWHFERSIFH